MHAIAHHFTPEQIGILAKAASEAGVDFFEVAHGDGLGGSCIGYGYGAASDREWLHAAKQNLAEGTRLSVLMCPGIGTSEDLEMAAQEGVTLVRIAVNCTEADVTQQHIGIAKKLGITPYAVLMMAHMLEPQPLLEQAKIAESFGAEGVYLMDSSGHLLPEGVSARVGLLSKELSIPVCFHAHANMDLHIPNTLAALQAGASQVDGTLRGLGAGAGNSPTEVLTAVLGLYGYETNVDLYKIMDAAELLAPMFDYVPIVDKVALTVGYAGVYGSFARHAKAAAERYGVDARDILLECGRRSAVGGQEDMIIAVAVELADAKSAEAR
jgi:4-hydroxy 2-oxovalerate aldolase